MSDRRLSIMPRSDWRVRSVLAAVVLFAPFLAADAVAQSDAGTVSATVTIQSDAVTVVGLQDLDFGTHFASEGIVPNEQAGAWQIDVSTDPTTVDLVLTVLPVEMENGGGFSIPLSYSPLSFGAQCGGIFVTADPLVGIPDCEITGGPAFAFLGEDIPSGVPLESVDADLTGALESGVYSATVELTATVN